MQPDEYIGLDVGEKRTGMARASAVARLPEALKTVNTADVLEELNDMIRSAPVAAIVVGLPRGLNGDDTAQTRWVRSWADTASQSIKVPFYFQDEALTTKLAQSRSGAPGHLDAEAAAIILQDFLNSQETEANA
jgi:putative Holliday junction resolvase